MEIQILHLTDKDSAYLDVLNHWMMEWWGNQAGFSADKMRSYLMHSINCSRLPQTFLLLDKDQPIGMYQLSMCDLEVRPDIYPWLINVYLIPDVRGKGIMNQIMTSVKEEARRLDLPELYLFTYHEGLYEKYGWNYIESFDTFIEDKRIQRLYHLPIST